MERYLLDRDIRAIPLRIGVTGTRGKSSVTRLIASCLKEGGYRVLAKTTGARPMIIYPDGEEKEIGRRGQASVLEQKKILRIGSRLRIDALVSELMSIHPESGFVEAAQVLKPRILVITNVRQDHLAQMGKSKDMIARGYASSFPEKATVFIPQEQHFSVFEEIAERVKSRVIKVSEDTAEDLHPEERASSFDWIDDRRLALAVAEFLKLDKEASFRGMAKARSDFGSLKAWRSEFDSPPRSCEFVNCFSANDPESTRLALSKLIDIGILKEKRIIGLLNLRGDRGDRTLQWSEALRQGVFPEFQKIYLIGFHAHAFKKRSKYIDSTLVVVKEKDPEEIMNIILEEEKEGFALVGIGNIAGGGKKLVEHWERMGSPYGL